MPKRGSASNKIVSQQCTFTDEYGKQCDVIVRGTDKFLCHIHAIPPKRDMLRQQRLLCEFIDIKGNACMAGTHGPVRNGTVRCFRHNYKSASNWQTIAKRNYIRRKTAKMLANLTKYVDKIKDEESETDEE